MKTPFSRLRSTAYHMVVASFVPWIRCHGRGGASIVVGDPGLDELTLRGDLARRRVDEEHGHRGETSAVAERPVGRRARGCSTPTCAARRGRARRRRAYGVDLRQLAALGDRRRARAAPSVDLRVLRRYAAALVRARPAPTHGRAQARRDPRVLPRAARARARRAEPRRPDLVAQAPQQLPRTLKPTEVAALLDRIPAADAARAARPRAVRARLRAAACAPRSSSNLDVGSVDFDDEEVRVEGKGAKTRFVPVGEAALRGGRALPRARPAGARGR